MSSFGTAARKIAARGAAAHWAGRKGLAARVPAALGPAALGPAALGPAALGLAGALALGGCETSDFTAPYTAASGEPRTTTGTKWDAAEEPEPPAFVEAACGGCHAVEPPFLSPNPEAPSFESIANRRGLSEVSLATWLKEAHNYPEQMDFDLDAAQADAIAAYMVRLQRDDYEPAQ